MAKKDYKNWDKNDLIKEIEQLRKRKKYGLVWEDKQEDVVERCKTELPILEEVKKKEIITDPEKPMNLLIEGDNYHALSVLNYTHKGKIDVIYIDPPYNTGKGKEWKFNDQWIDKNDSYRHSKWLSFISKRLHLAKNLLSTKGVIFISIDDNEYATLKLLCDDIFREKKYVGTLIWEKKKKGSHLDKNITNIKEYVLVYKKTEAFKGLVGVLTEKKVTYPCLNPGNTYSTRIIPKGTISNYRKSDVTLKKGEVISAGNMKLVLHSDLVIKNKLLVKDVVVEAEWRYGQDKINEYRKDKSLYFTRDLYLRRIVTDLREKKLKDLLPRVEEKYLSDLKDDLIEEFSKEKPNLSIIESIQKEIASINDKGGDIKNLFSDGWGSNEDADNEQRDFFGKKVFNYPKPSKLIRKLIASTRMTKATILDFYAGTGTTAQAVSELRGQGFDYKFIICTNNEDNNEDNLQIATDICYPRVKKVITGYKRRKGEKVIGTGGNLKYFKTAFVPADSTDKSRKELTKKATEMLCIKEDTFKEIKSTEKYKVFRNKKRYTGIIYDYLAIDDFKKEIVCIDGKFSVYVFSLSDDTFDEEFEDVKNKVKLSPIPEAILRVYRRIFK